MNAWAHRLSALCAIAHLAIGIPELLKIGPRFLPASWVLIYGWLPDWLDWLWPGAFVLIGVLSALGAYCPPFLESLGTSCTLMLRAAFRLSAAVYFVWGSASIYGWIYQTGGTLPGSFTYYLLAGTFWAMAHYVPVVEKAEETRQAIKEIVEQAIKDMP